MSSSTLPLGSLPMSDPTPQQIQGKTAWTALTPRFSVQYAAYIPVDHVPGPTACPFYGIVPTRWTQKLYLGDAYRGSYRTTQSLFVIPDIQTNNNFFSQTGATRNYGYGSPSNNGLISSYLIDADPYDGRYGGSDEDGVRNDCYLWNDKDHADTGSMSAYGISFPTGTQAQVNFYGSAPNPLEPSLFGNISIKWNMTVIIDDSSPNQPTAYVTYTHTCYPAHIVKVNGVVVYERRPNQNDPDYLSKCLTGRLPQIMGQSSPVPKFPRTEDAKPWSMMEGW
jgi:hypothetical protein